MIIMGVDPGIHGGLAIVAVEDGAAPRLVEAIDIPVIGIGAKERVDVAAIRNFIDQHKPIRALIERAQAMPKQGSQQRFQVRARRRRDRSGDRAVLDPGEIVEPSVWKRFWQTPGQRQGRRAAAGAAAVSGRACGARAQERPRPGRGLADRIVWSQVMNAPLEPAHSPFGGSVAARVLRCPASRRARREGAGASAQVLQPMPIAARRSTRRWRF